jgi:hypothetical protein
LVLDEGFEIESLYPKLGQVSGYTDYGDGTRMEYVLQGVRSTRTVL